MIRIVFRQIKIQNFVHICFIECTKLACKIWLKDLFELLGKLDLIEEDFRIRQNLYEE